MTGLSLCSAISHRKLQAIFFIRRNLHCHKESWHTCCIACTNHSSLPKHRIGTLIEHKYGVGLSENCRYFLGSVDARPEYTVLDLSSEKHESGNVVGGCMLKVCDPTWDIVGVYSYNDTKYSCVAYYCGCQRDWWMGWAYCRMASSERLVPTRLVEWVIIT